MTSERRAISGSYQAIAWIVISNLAFTCMQALIRHNSVELHQFQVAFLRNFVGLLIMLPWLIRLGPAVLKTDRLGLHLLRSFLQAGSMLLFFTAVNLAPLAVISAISFTGPLFTAVGGVLILGEKIRRRRMLALAIGFVGAIIILRPGFGDINPGALLSLESSAIWGGILIIIRILTRTESTTTIVAYMVLFMTPISLVPALPYWQWPSTDLYVWLLLMGAVGQLGHYAVTRAIHLAETTMLMPFEFTRLIWAALLGLMIFNELPDLWAVTGGAIILGATTYIAYRESQLDKRKLATPAVLPPAP